MRQVRDSRRDVQVGALGRAAETSPSLLLLLRGPRLLSPLPGPRSRAATRQPRRKLRRLTHLPPWNGHSGGSVGCPLIPSNLVLWSHHRTVSGASPSSSARVRERQIVVSIRGRPSRPSPARKTTRRRSGSPSQLRAVSHAPVAMRAPARPSLSFGLRHLGEVVEPHEEPEEERVVSVLGSDTDPVHSKHAASDQWHAPVVQSGPPAVLGHYDRPAGRDRGLDVPREPHWRLPRDRRRLRDRSVQRTDVHLPRPVGDHDEAPEDFGRQYRRGQLRAARGQLRDAG